MMNRKPLSLGLLTAALDSEPSPGLAPEPVAPATTGISVPKTEDFLAFCQKLGVSNEGHPILIWAHIGVEMYRLHLNQRPRGRPRGTHLTEMEKKAICGVERRLAAYARHLSASIQKFKETGFYDPSTFPPPLDFNKALRLELRAFPDADQERARKKLTRYWNARSSGSLLADLLSKGDGNKSKLRAVRIKKSDRIN